MPATRVPLALLSIAMAVAGAKAAAAADGADLTNDLEALIRRADFDAAEERAETLLRSGSLTRPQAARVYLALGVVSSARRTPDKAERAFRRALTLESGLALPSWVGPHVAADLDRARAAMPSPPPAPPSVNLTPIPGAPRIKVDAAGTTGDALARRLVVRVAGARDEHDLGEEPTAHEVSLPTSVAGCATASVGLLDEYGNELWPAIASAEACRPTGEGPAPALDLQIDWLRVAAAQPGSVARTRALWISGATTGAALVATGVLGWVALERRDDYHRSLDRPPGDQPMLMAEASTAQHRATVSAVITGVLAAGTLVLYLVTRR